MRANTVVDFATARESGPRRLASAAGPEREAPVPPIPVLLVEPDPLLRELLSAALRLHHPNLALVLATGPREALRLAQQGEFRLVVSEMELPTPDDGQRFLAALHEVSPLTPVLVLTEGASQTLAALLDLDVAVVTKPPDMDHLLRRVDQLLAERSGSLVRGISLEGLLQVLKAERKTCQVAVEIRGARGRLALVEGRLVHAETARSAGIAALFETLGWRDPVLRIATGAPASASAMTERTIESDLDSLLLRFCIETDHQRRDAADGLD